jgi:hypothetical protein
MAGVRIDFAGIPGCLAPLAGQRRWVGWRWEARGSGKPTKPPRTVIGGRANGYAKNDDPATWATFDEAHAAQAAGGVEGVGLQILNLKRFVAIDLDNVRNEGELLPWAADLIARAGSYAEWTPSGAGARIIGRVPRDHASLHVGSTKHPGGGAFELWANASTGRFLTVTGARIDGTPDEARDVSAAVAELVGLRADDRSSFRIDTGAADFTSGPADAADAEEVRELLSFVDPDLPYGEWLAVLMALHDHFGDAGLALAEEWSARGAKYAPGEVAAKWRGFKPGGGVGIGTVAEMARRGGADLSAIRRRHMRRRVGGACQHAEAPQFRAEVAEVDPVDLWGQFDPPELPAGLLPSVIERFARVQGERMGADPAGLAVAALVTCAAAIPDQIAIQVKRHDAWAESPRLWAALVGLPSTKKSPILSAATAPLCRLDREMFRDWQREAAEFNRLTKEERAGRNPPPQRRLRIEDATVEAAQIVLEGSEWGVMLLQDELSGFFGAMDKYNGGKGAAADRAFWLRSFNGGEFALNRVGRGATLIPNLSVCLLGGIQPEPIRRVAGDAHDDGLLQRLFPIVLRPATMGTDTPAPDVVGAYADLVQRLRELRPPGFLGASCIQFDAAAQAIRRKMEAKHLSLQSLETINGKLAAHVGKYDGLFARLCLVWHCVENAEQERLPDTIGEATARRVGQFLHLFLLRHAMAFYSGVLALSDDHDRLTALAAFILAQRKELVSNRDVATSVRAMRGLEGRDVRRLFEQLEALGWLEQTPGPRPSSPPQWIVNPAVHRKFDARARREVERRREVREAILQAAEARKVDFC